MHCFPTDNPYSCDRDTNGSYWSYQQQDPHQTVVHPQQQQNYSSQWSHNGGYNQEALGMKSCWMPTAQQQQQQQQHYQPHHHQMQRQTLTQQIPTNSSCMGYANQQQYSQQQMMYTQQQQQIQPLQMQQQQPGGFYRNNVVATVTLQSAVTSSGPCSSRTPSRCDSVRSEACESSCSTLSGGGSGGVVIDPSDMMSPYTSNPTQGGSSCHSGLYNQQQFYNNYQPHQDQLQLQQQQQQQQQQQCFWSSSQRYPMAAGMQQQQMAGQNMNQQQQMQIQMQGANHQQGAAVGGQFNNSAMQQQGQNLQQYQQYQQQMMYAQQQQYNQQQMMYTNQQQLPQQQLLLEEQEEEEILEGQFDCSLGPMLTTDGDTSIDDDEALAACSSTSSVTSPQSQLNPSPIGTCLADTTASPSMRTEVAAPTTPPSEPQPEELEPEQLSLSPQELHIQSELLIELPSTTTSSSPVPVATTAEIVHSPPSPPPSEPTLPELAAPVNVPDGWTRDVSAGSVIYIR